MAQFLEKKLLNMKCVFWFSPQLCLQHFSFWEELSKTWSQIYLHLHRKYHLFWSNFYETWILSTDFWKMHKYKNSVGAKLFHADEWTDTMKLRVAFRNFANMPKNWTLQCDIWNQNDSVLQQTQQTAKTERNGEKVGKEQERKETWKNKVKVEQKSKQKDENNAHSKWAGQQR